MPRLSLALLAFLSITLSSYAQSVYELRGPNRDGIYPKETNLLKQWPAEGPELVKTIVGIGEGFTLPVVTDNAIYVTGMVDSTGYLFAYDLQGELKWKKAYGKEWTENYPGSRSTPTVVDNCIYFEDSFGIIYCYDDSGLLVWSINMEKFGFRSIQWGASEALLVVGDKVFCTPGGTHVMMAVLDRFTGETLTTIKGNGQKSAHCSPVLINHGYKSLILTMTEQALVGIDAFSYQMVFQYPFGNSWGGNPNTPLYKDGKILLTTETAGSAIVALSPDALRVSEIWKNTLYDSENEGAVLHDGVVYLGANNLKTWYCFDWETGAMKYSDKKIGRANVVMADGLLYTYNFRGYVSLVKPNAEKLEVISQFKMTAGSLQHITHLVIKNGKLYVRRGNAMNIYNISES